MVGFPPKSSILIECFMKKTSILGYHYCRKHPCRIELAGTYIYIYLSRVISHDYPIYFTYAVGHIKDISETSQHYTIHGSYTLRIQICPKNPRFLYIPILWMGFFDHQSYSIGRGLDS